MSDILNDGRVAVVKAESTEYGATTPFSPSEKNAEYPFEFHERSECKNYAYQAVRDALCLLELDKNHFETREWNPLGEIIKPGDFVVIKPNFVSDTHRAGGELYSVITHPAVIRAVCDYVVIALQNCGRIVIADAPQADTDFEHLVHIIGLKEMIDFYQDKTAIKIEFLDLRQLVLKNHEDSSTRKLATRDPMGYSIVDLAYESEFETIDGLERIYGSDYDRFEIRNHHQKGKHEYCVANTILNANVIINIPKIKTHRKAGVTLSMKNMVGINGNKNYLPHFRVGTPEDGGDEFHELQKDEKKILYTKRFLQDSLLARKNRSTDMLYEKIRKTYNFFKKRKRLQSTENRIEAGNWYGNDTIWRTVIDLNRILIYAGKDGDIKETPQRNYITFLDGIWGGEGEGPLTPDLKKFGYIIVGFNPLLTDIVAVKLMGFDYHKIPLLEQSVKGIGKKLCLSRKTENEINLCSNERNNSNYKDMGICECKFSAAQGWKTVLN